VQAPAVAPWCRADEDGVGVGFPEGDEVAPVPPAPARLGPELVGTGLVGTGLVAIGLLGTVPGVADPEPGVGGAE